MEYIHPIIGVTNRPEVIWIYKQWKQQIYY